MRVPTAIETTCRPRLLDLGAAFVGANDHAGKGGGGVVGSGDQEAWRRAYERSRPRPSTARRRYDHDWRELRDAVLAGEPNCRVCARNGIEKRAVMVDHIEPIRVAPDRRLDPSNVQPYAGRVLKSNRFDGGFGKWGSKWDASRAGGSRGGLARFRRAPGNRIAKVSLRAVKISQ